MNRTVSDTTDPPQANSPFSMTDTSPFSAHPSPSTTDGGCCDQEDDNNCQSPGSGRTSSSSSSSISSGSKQNLLELLQHKATLHGPASLMRGDAIIVPPLYEDEDEELLDGVEGEGERKQAQPQQPKEHEIMMIATMADLPLVPPIQWNYDQKLNWMKCMLSRHLPQPRPQDVEQRLIKLQEVERQLQQNRHQQLEQFILIFAEQFPNNSVVNKLHQELIAWQNVCSSIESIAFNSIIANSAASEKPVSDHLWEHILRLLMNKDPTVEWLAMEGGLFRFVDSSGAARSWGMTKGNQNMSYEKMSRSIRQYYTEGKTGIIQKAVEYPKLHYRFNMFHPEVVHFLRKNFFHVCQEDAFLNKVLATNTC